MEAYSDGNGTFYIDSCLEFANIDDVGYDTAYIIASVNNYIDYALTSTAVSNGGFEYWQLGVMDYYTGYEDYVNGQSSAFFGSYNGLSGVEPQSTPLTMHYIVGVGTGPVGPVLKFAVTSSGSEGISLTAPQNTMTSLPLATPYEDNFTWVFKINNGYTAAGYYNSFVDPIGDAVLFIPSFNPSDTYLAILPVDFENLVVTSTHYFGLFCTYELMWTDAEWIVIITPVTQTSSGYLFSFNDTGVTYFPGNIPNSYLTGLTTATTLCNSLPTPP
ncbi:hypothetical protein [Vulcanisaeta thermophila]|uniref:hypothetical protein n=1 Tax=Vulcanisaeta thermophila TaxID=867917 RepID=UPI000AE71224|nr:hypothetical protein [Vulcanisaeta thermophila]